MTSSLLHKRISEEMQKKGKAQACIEQLMGLMKEAGLNFEGMSDFVLSEIAAQAFMYANGNQCEAARLLGVHRNTFSRWLQLWLIFHKIGAPHRKPVDNVKWLATRMVRSA